MEDNEMKLVHTQSETMRELEAPCTCVGCASYRSRPAVAMADNGEVQRPLCAWCAGEVLAMSDGDLHCLDAASDALLAAMRPTWVYMQGRQDAIARDVSGRMMRPVLQPPPMDVQYAAMPCPACGDAQDACECTSEIGSMV